MKKEITAEKAIKTWYYLLITTSIAWIVVILLWMRFFEKSDSSFTGLIFILAFFTPIIFIYFARNKWRIWALTHVDNVHKLKRKTEGMFMVSMDTEFFEQIEHKKLNHFEDKKVYRDIRSRLAQEEVFTDDKTVPDETVIYFSKAKSWLAVAVSLVCLSFALFLFFSLKDKFDGYGIFIVVFILLIFFVSIVVFFDGFRKLNNVEPQITINNRGIKTIATDFYKWEEIEYAKIKSVSSGTGKSRTIKHYLTYKHPKGKEEINIYALDISRKELTELLILYRERSKLQKQI